MAREKGGERERWRGAKGDRSANGMSSNPDCEKGTGLKGTGWAKDGDSDCSWLTCMSDSWALLGRGNGVDGVTRPASFHGVVEIGMSASLGGLAGDMPRFVSKI